MSAAGPSPDNWPWDRDLIAALSPDEHARWREASGALRAGHEARLGRKLTGRELIDLCDAPAWRAVLVTGGKAVV